MPNNFGSRMVYRLWTVMLLTEINQELILQTITQFSGTSDEYLKILGTEDSFLSINDNNIVSFLLPSMISADCEFQLPDRLQIELISGRIAFSAKNNWLKISFPEESISYFQNFVIQCLAQLKEHSSLSALKSIINNWKKHWTFGKNKLTLEERIGLFGELILLNHALHAEPPMAWSSWQGFGVNPGLHDFTSQDFQIEVKTTTSIEDASMHVFDARQFFYRASTHLCVIKIEENQSGDNLFDLCEDLIRGLNSLGVSDHPLNVVKKIQEDATIYQHERYEVSSAGYYRLEQDGPFIQQEDLGRTSVTNVSYEIKLESIPLIWDPEISQLYDLIFE